MIFICLIQHIQFFFYRKLREKALSEDTPITVKEYSRENKPREKINPVFAAMKEQADVVRRDLRSLYMNRELKRNEKSKEDEADPLEEMMKKLNAIDKEDIGTGQ